MPRVEVPDGWGEDPEDLAEASTHLDDEAYGAFIASEFGKDGRPRRGPRVGLVLVLLGIALVVLLYLRSR